MPFLSNSFSTKKSAGFTDKLNTKNITNKYKKESNKYKPDITKKIMKTVHFEIHM